MNKSSIIASVSGALVAASLVLAGPAAAAGHGHGGGPAAPGHEAVAQPAPAAGVERPSSQGLSTPAPVALSAPSTRVESSGGLAPAGLDGFGSGRAAVGEAPPAALSAAPAAAVHTSTVGTGELPFGPVGQ